MWGDEPRPRRRVTRAEVIIGNVLTAVAVLGIAVWFAVIR